MDYLFDTLMARPIVLIGVGLFLALGAVRYIVLQRARRHEIENNRKAGI